jgi:hypothetical protein
VATSSALAVAIIGAVAISVIAMQRRAVRRRQLRYRVTQAASRAIHAGLNRSTAAVGCSLLVGGDKEATIRWHDEQEGGCRVCRIKECRHANNHPVVEY